MFGNVPLEIKKICLLYETCPADRFQRELLSGISCQFTEKKTICETAVTYFSIIVAHADRETSQKENIILDVLCTEGHSFFLWKTLHMGFNQQLISLTEIKKQASILRLNNFPYTER